MSITLIRHTTPDIQNGTCYGRSDIDVAASFAAEAKAVVATLGSADRLVSSPLLRCQKLAREISAATGLSVDTDDRLLEMDFGTWELRLWSDIPRQELDQWANDFLFARPHGGECVATLQKRAISAVDEFRDSGQKCLVVTHAGIIKSILANGTSSQDFQADVPFGGISVLPPT